MSKRREKSDRVNHLVRECKAALTRAFYTLENVEILGFLKKTLEILDGNFPNFCVFQQKILRGFVKNSWWRRAGADENKTRSAEVGTHFGPAHDGSVYCPVGWRARVRRDRVRD